MTDTKHSWIYNQLFVGWKPFEVKYVSVLLSLQLIVFMISPDSVIGMISGVAGVICLVYGMKGRKITFLFGIIQCLAMTYIAWQSHAYGSFVMNIIYVISQPIGWFLWGNDGAVHEFKPKTKQFLFLGSVIAWVIGWIVIGNFGGQLPYIDSANLVISLIAQTLYIFKYKENWSLWIFVNIANLLYWSLLAFNSWTGKSDIGSLGIYLSQIALQAALLFNSIYANKVWKDYETN
ncbi:nicotinamide riboside transporter PnuC [Vagococcus teuberi]